MVEQRRRAIDSEIVEGYRRIPSPTVDEWGDLEEQQRLWSQIAAAALDAEDGGWS